MLPVHTGEKQTLGAHLFKVGRRRNPRKEKDHALDERAGGCYDSIIFWRRGGDP